MKVLAAATMRVVGVWAAAEREGDDGEGGDAAEDGHSASLKSGLTCQDGPKMSMKVVGWFCWWN